MLDRARDADGDVKFGCHDLAGLADLPVVRSITRIHRGARGTHRGTELVGDRLDVFREIFLVRHGAAARDDDARGGQFRTIRLRKFLADERGETRVARTFGVLDRGRAAFARRLEGGGTYGDDLLLVGRLYGLDRVPGIDRALERVRALDLDDFGNLHHVEQRRHARHEVFARGRRGRNDRVIFFREFHDEGRHRFGELVLEGGVVRQEHFLDARDFRSGIGDGFGALARNQHIDVAAERACRRHRLERCRVQRLVVVFGNKECCHDQITPASFLSLSTRLATESTFTPALRPAGSEVFRTFRRGVTSTP